MPTPGSLTSCASLCAPRAVSLVNGQAYQLPITQAELGDATGMSTVHVNRTLQEGASSLRIGGAANRSTPPTSTSSKRPRRSLRARTLPAEQAEVAEA